MAVRLRTTVRTQAVTLIVLGARAAAVMIRVTALVAVKAVSMVPSARQSVARPAKMKLVTRQQGNAPTVVRHQLDHCVKMKW